MENWKIELESLNFGNETVEKIFELYFNGEKNIVTPIVYAYGGILAPTRILLIEKSKNDEETVFGITTLAYDKITRTLQRIDLSRGFETEKQANEYLYKLTLGEIEMSRLYGRKL